MAAAVEAMECATAAGDTVAQDAAHRAFHLALVARSGHRHLIDVYEPVILKLQLYMATNMRREAVQRPTRGGPAAAPPALRSGARRRPGHDRRRAVPPRRPHLPRSRAGRASERNTALTARGFRCHQTVDNRRSADFGSRRLPDLDPARGLRGRALGARRRRRRPRTPRGPRRRRRLDLALRAPRRCTPAPPRSRSAGRPTTDRRSSGCRSRSRTTSTSRACRPPRPAPRSATPPPSTPRACACSSTRARSPSARPTSTSSPPG